MPELVIGDHNWRDFVGDGRVFQFNGPRFLGALPRATRFGECEVATAADFELIPPEEWDERIAENDAKRLWLDDIVGDKIPTMDQNGLGYCHAYGATQAAHVQRLQQGHPFVGLSAESIGGPITNWQNRGAHPEDDLRQFAQYGACPASYMDRSHSLNHRAWEPGWEQARRDYRIIEWWDCEIPGKAWEASVTMTLLGIPHFGGFAWWSHAYYLGLRLRKQNGRYQRKDWNSWGPEWGEKGRFWSEGSKAIPDIGCFAPRVMSATG